MSKIGELLLSKFQPAPSLLNQRPCPLDHLTSRIFHRGRCHATPTALASGKSGRGKIRTECPHLSNTKFPLLLLSHCIVIHGCKLPTIGSNDNFTAADALDLNQYPATFLQSQKQVGSTCADSILAGVDSGSRKLLSQVSSSTL